MAWLEAELNRVQQHVSQLQTRRQELSSQVGRLTSSSEFNCGIDAIESACNSPIRVPASAADRFNIVLPATAALPAIAATPATPPDGLNSRTLNNWSLFYFVFIDFLI